MAVTSSGELTSSAASTPFSAPDGSGAFKQACQRYQYARIPTMVICPYLNQVLALGLGHEWLKLGRGEGVDKPGL